MSERMVKEELLLRAKIFTQNPKEYTNPYKILSWLEEVEHELTEEEDDLIREWASECFEM